VRKGAAAGRQLNGAGYLRRSAPLPYISQILTNKGDKSCLFGREFEA
jgi:hypothetical protein